MALSPRGVSRQFYDPELPYQGQFDLPPRDLKIDVDLVNNDAQPSPASTPRPFVASPTPSATTPEEPNTPTHPQPEPSPSPTLDVTTSSPTDRDLLTFFGSLNMASPLSPTHHLERVTPLGDGPTSPPPPCCPTSSTTGSFHPGLSSAPRLRRYTRQGWCSCGRMRSRRRLHSHRWTQPSTTAPPSRMSPWPPVTTGSLV